jgi:predicted DNA-binding transcriptional regulator AlpA
MPTASTPALPGKKPSSRDLKWIESSWIPPDLAAQALIRRVSDQEARELVGSNGRKGDMAGLIFPYVWPGEEQVREYRLRRDSPDIEYKGDQRREVNKCLSPPGRQNMLYFASGTAPEWLSRATLPIVITEGEKKTLALWRLAQEAAGEKAKLPKFLPVGLSGVWNWRGTIGKETGPNGERQDVKGPIPDMHKVSWKERKVSILFDSNVRGNDSVRAARRELARWLVEQGAKVYLVDIPPEPGVNGIDDYLAKHGTEPTLKMMKRARLAEKAPPPQQSQAEKDEPYLASAGNYHLTESSMVYFRTNRDGSASRMKLSNFPAVITADIVKDDGESKTRAFKAHAAVRGKPMDNIVDSAEFNTMSWVLDGFGRAANVYPNMKEHLRSAMQELSKESNELYVYQHTGWTQISGKPVYLHAGGGLGADGPVTDLLIELDHVLRRFSLPEPPRGRELVRAIRSSLEMLEIAPDRVTIPLYCAVWRAVLGIVDVSIHLSGQTGSGKSQIAALAQQHFGAGLDAKHLPANWDSTANTLQAICFHAKNALIVVDDFVPKGSASDVARMHREADRLLRAQGNHAGRQRMSADTRIRPPKTPRGLILSTGEDVPKGNSLRARLVVVEMDPQDMKWNLLTECQHNARAGLYSQAMAGFIQWIAPRLDSIDQRIIDHLARFREEWGDSGHHKRTPDNLANLSCGLEVFLDFCRETSAITSQQADSLWERSLVAFRESRMQPQKPKVVSLKTDEDSPIMTIPEVAAYLRISKTQVHKLINGKLPGPVPRVMHIGGRIIFKKAWIDRWLEESSRQKL